MYAERFCCSIQNKFNLEGCFIKEQVIVHVRALEVTDTLVSSKTMHF